MVTMRVKQDICYDVKTLTNYKRYIIGFNCSHISLLLHEITLVCCHSVVQNYNTMLSLVITLFCVS